MRATDVMEVPWYVRQVADCRQALREAEAEEQAAKARRKAAEAELELTLIGLERAAAEDENADD